MTVQANTQIINVVDTVFEKKEEKPVNGISMWESLRWKALVAEFISTTFLLFLGCMACIPATGLDIHPPMYAPFGFGLAVLFNITSFGHISGAHMNPSVTLSAILYGTMSIPLGIGYFIAQCLGATVGYGLLMGVSTFDLAEGSICITQPLPNQAIYQSLIIEIILSAALGFINCAVWDPVNQDKNDGLPLKFGFTIAGLSLAGGPLTGASMNPARSLAPAIWTGNWNTHWVYWAGPFIGGAFAAIFYRLIWLDRKVNQSDTQAVARE